MPCLARLPCILSKYDVTPTRSVYMLDLCKREAESGSLLCSDCGSFKQEHKQLATEFSLTAEDGCLVYRKIAGKEFEAKYNKLRGTLVLTGNQPVTWPSTLPTVFASPTRFAKETVRAVQGLSADPKVNGWVTCYTKDEKGNRHPLQKIRGTSYGSEMEKSEKNSFVSQGTLIDSFPPSSTVYGSPGFWKLIEKKGGKDIPLEWLEEAEARNQDAKEWCQRAGVVFYEVWVQSLEGINNEMPKKLNPLPKAEDLPAKAKVTNYIKTVTKFYNETADEPVKLATDTQKIWLELVDEEEVWVCETGFVFTNNEGKVGKPLGKLVEGCLNKF